MVYLENCPSCGMLALEHDRGLFEPYPYCHLCGWRETSPAGNSQMAVARDMETALADRPSGSEAAHIGEIRTTPRLASLKVVAISGYPRTPAGEMGRRISRSLSFDYYNRLLVERVARKLGATVDAVQSKAARPDTIGDRLTRLLERMMESSARGAAESELFFGYRYPGHTLTTEEDEPTVHYIRTIPADISDADFAAATVQVINEISESGNAVIVHPLACAALSGSTETLRIGVFMDDEDRVQAVADELGATRREASKLLADEDRSLEVMCRKRFGADADSASTYDLALNVSRLGIDAAIEQALEAVRSRRDLAEAADSVEEHAAAVAGAAAQRRTPLERVDVFRELPEWQVRGISALGEVISVASGSELASADAIGDSVYAVLSGQVELSTDSAVGRITVRISGEGESFPLASLLGTGRLITTAEAMTDVVLWKVDRSKLQSYLQERPEIGIKVYDAAARVMADRYRQTLSRLTKATEKAINSPEHSTRREGSSESVV